MIPVSSLLSDNFDDYYSKLFIEIPHLKLHGFSYEMGINENVVDRIEDYIVQIEIPVFG